MYPNDIDTLSSLFVASNGTRTKLMQGISAAQTSIVVQSADGLDLYGGVVAIEGEIIFYGAINTTGPYPVLELCMRGFDGTSAAIHPTGSTVELRIVAAHHNVLASRLIAIETAIGLNPAADSSGAAVSFSSLADRLTKALPQVVPCSLGTDWSFQHNRRRLVGLQCWRKVASDHERFEPTLLRQNVNPLGLSSVTIQFTPAAEGYVVVL